MKISKSFFIFLFAVIIAATAFSANRHRFHTTLTRIDYNAEGKNFEISIQLFIHDLAPLLERRGGKRINIEKSPETDRLIFEYLNETFVLTDKNNAAKTLKWIGKEVDADSVRIYVEIVSNENPEGYNLKNTIFFESQPEQVNLVVCNYDGKKADLLFKVGDKSKAIKENKPAAEK